MSNVKVRAYRTLASIVIVGVGACSTAGSDAVSRISSPSSGPEYAIAPIPRIAHVCKSGASATGSYTFTTINTGTTNSNDVLTSPVTVSVVKGGPDICATVYQRTEATNLTSDPSALLTITEAAAPGTILGNITDIVSATVPVIDIPGRKVTVSLNVNHDASATFFNVAVSLGCTYTQGWYKNHADQWPAGDYSSFDGGKSWLDLYNTPPRGSQYIILAHQYMTATLNIAGGASLPADVKIAYDKATAYFAAGGPGAGSGDIAGVSAILDAYNNGLSTNGPPHCEK